MTVEKKLYRFIDAIVGNRVFDIYLKIMGISTLSSATLVPVALLLGKQEFVRYVDYIRKEQKGGQSWEDGQLVYPNFSDQKLVIQQGGVHIPVLDAPAIGTFLKLAGLYNLPLSPYTLIPLGVAMFIYDMAVRHYKHKQKGGRPVKDLFYEFMESLVGNRVLDIYLKIMGIGMLNSYTLVPVGLLYGKEVFKDYIETIQKGRTQHGGRHRFNIPFVDDPLIGNFLKMAGLYYMPFTTTTLIPLGIAMVIYHLYREYLPRGEKARKLLTFKSFYKTDKKSGSKKGRGKKTKAEPADDKDE